jgi:hypothetical protein
MNSTLKELLSGAATEGETARYRLELAAEFASRVGAAGAQAVAAKYERELHALLTRLGREVREMLSPVNHLFEVKPTSPYCGWPGCGRGFDEHLEFGLRANVERRDNT